MLAHIFQAYLYVPILGTILHATMCFHVHDILKGCIKVNSSLSHEEFVSDGSGESCGLVVESLRLNLYPSLIPVCFTDLDSQNRILHPEW